MLRFGARRLLVETACPFLVQMRACLLCSLKISPVLVQEAHAFFYEKDCSHVDFLSFVPNNHVLVA
jgi:hypothetical protein